MDKLKTLTVTASALALSVAAPLPANAAEGQSVAVPAAAAALVSLAGLVAVSAAFPMSQYEAFFGENFVYILSKDWL